MNFYEVAFTANRSDGPWTFTKVGVLKQVDITQAEADALNKGRAAYPNPYFTLFLADENANPASTYALDPNHAIQINSNTKPVM